jgi:pimeloyl-ACP methyl ester carboxylesterase
MISSREISTTVRTGAAWAHKLAFRVLQAASTELSARALELAFLTPPHKKPTPAEQEFLASGEHETVAAPGGSLAVWSWGEGRTVVLVHGWGSQASRYRTMAPALVAAGFRVVAFDAPAHGYSSGRRSSLPETARALRFMARRERQRRGAWPHAVVGHSFGCAALILAQESNLRFARNVLLAPVADLAGHFDRVVRDLGIETAVARRMIARTERRLGFSWEAIRVARFARRLQAPALIVHDPEDAEVSFDDALVLRDAWAGAQLIEARGLGHRRLLHDAAVARRVVSFLNAS